MISSATDKPYPKHPSHIFNCEANLHSFPKIDFRCENGTISQTKTEQPTETTQPLSEIKKEQNTPR